jgi:hypothetical protein
MEGHGARLTIGSWYFSVSAPGAKTVILCESAIDAISCFELHPFCLCASTSGARPNPLWLQWLISQSFKIYCGFDSDLTGDAMSNKMLTLHHGIKRLLFNTIGMMSSCNAARR